MKNDIILVGLPIIVTKLILLSAYSYRIILIFGNMEIFDNSLFNMRKKIHFDMRIKVDICTDTTIYIG